MLALKSIHTLAHLSLFCYALLLCSCKTEECKIKLKADYSFQAAELIEKFDKNALSSKAQYLDRTIEIVGPLSEVHEGTNGILILVLGSSENLRGVSCEVPIYKSSVFKKLKAGAVLKLKGVCKEQDKEIVMENCILI